MHLLLSWGEARLGTRRASPKPRVDINFDTLDDCIFSTNSESGGYHAEHLPNNNRALAGGADDPKWGRNGGKSSKKTRQSRSGSPPHPQMSPPSRMACGHPAAGMLEGDFVHDGDANSPHGTPDVCWLALAPCEPGQRCCLPFRVSPRPRVPHGASWRVGVAAGPPAPLNFRQTAARSPSFAPRAERSRLVYPATSRR